MESKKTANPCGVKTVSRPTCLDDVFSPEELAWLGNHLTSFRQLCAEKGLDWEEVGTAIVEGKAELIKEAHLRAKGHALLP